MRTELLCRGIVLVYRCYTTAMLIGQWHITHAAIFVCWHACSLLFPWRQRGFQDVTQSHLLDSVVSKLITDRFLTFLLQAERRMLLSTSQRALSADSGGLGGPIWQHASPVPARAQTSYTTPPYEEEPCFFSFISTPPVCTALITSKHFI